MSFINKIICRLMCWIKGPQYNEGKYLDGKMVIYPFCERCWSSKPRND